MLWQVRALLDDRPGALAALAARCGEQNVNILALQLFPAVDGRVVDELVLHTPGGWDAARVADLCVLAGVERPVVSECAAQALEDQPVRYLRAARVVSEHPGRLEEQLCRLLEARPAAGHLRGGGRDTLVLEDADGPAVALAREVPFTDAERARASELRRLAAGTAEQPSRAHPDPVGHTSPAERLELRRGTTDDAGLLAEMHARCSADTVLRRYHAPMPRLAARLARALLEPVGGTSMVLLSGGELVAHGVLAHGDEGPEVGVVVEDAFQRRGHGTRLLYALAVHAAQQGLTELRCHVLPGDDAVPATIRRAGLRAHVTWSDGLLAYLLPLSGLPVGRGNRGRKPAMGSVTAGLVDLLNARGELRDICPRADLIDQAVRGGA